MNIIASLEEKLKAFPQVRYVAGSDFIEIEAPREGGFPVNVCRHEDRFVVAFSGWYDAFTTREEALECFDFAFSDRCRVRVESRAGVPYSWTREYLVEGAWQADSTVRSTFVPAWGAVRERFLCNRELREEDE